MFYKYEIRNMSGEDILYLYLTLQYEFANEFLEDENLNFLSKNFIKVNNINFKGNKVYLVVDGIIVKSLDISNDISNISKNYSPDYFLVNLAFDDNSMCEITLREYLLSILFSYYSDELKDEVMKAICVLYNTYAYRMMTTDGYISSNNSFNVYKHYTQYDNIYASFNTILNKLNNIINDVACVYLSYNNNYILPFIHYSNSGRTLSNLKYPYLSSVKSLWDITSPSYINIVHCSYEDLNNKFGVNIDSSSKIDIIDNGKLIKLGDSNFSLLEVKSMLHLKSSDISIIINKDDITFVTKGVGNSLGLSIYGAMMIENNGGKYNNILNYYFPKTKICRYIKELSK